MSTHHARIISMHWHIVIEIKQAELYVVYYLSYKKGKEKENVLPKETVEY